MFGKFDADSLIPVRGNVDVEIHYTLPIRYYWHQNNNGLKYINPKTDMYAGYFASHPPTNYLILGHSAIYNPYANTLYFFLYHQPNTLVRID